MMTKEQEKEITDYLIFHRLPLDILVEVKDHMISQVTDIQIEENLNFQEAFHKTQKLWESEFKMTKYSVFYSEEIPVIVKKIAKARYNNILKRSLLLGLISFAVNILLIFLANNEEVYSSLFKIQNGLFVLFTFGVWFFNRKIWKYVKQDFKYRGRLFYSMYQQNTGLLVVSMTSMAQIISKKGIYPYLFFRTNDHSEIIFVLATLVLPYCIQVMIIFGLMNFFEHKKSLEKMKNFLNLSSE
ncbi:hypothetical protein QX233_10200 [Chryseobacterium gambrini]|uniref:Uncharacterized protein n=2 Tax=Chryseobacterium TaxID=59732 RepID=A0AAJ1R5T8_9FLAO|nr:MULTISPECIES: hypothetical protein [Chryseobacterium]MDN4012834.1 hypothetical protein [Chryseobacterium gambrini]MDN4030657.1 hypothetical protein [Chryseobacterium gambrini]QWA36626.1 hypothetical protein KKI44_11750 [Chryseobacterium sp. ZHDP1]